MTQFFASSGQSIGVSALASVLPMDIQGSFTLGLTGLISLQSKHLSRVFSSTTIRKHQFFGVQPSLVQLSQLYMFYNDHFSLLSSEPQDGGVLCSKTHENCVCVCVCVCVCRGRPLILLSLAVFLFSHQLTFRLQQFIKITT